MAFDGAFLQRLRQQLSPALCGARVDRIYQPTKAVLVLMLRSKTFNGKLLLSAEPGGARIQFTRAEIENPAVPPMLCMLLRKKLVGGRLVAIRQAGLERIVYLDFDTVNELGDPLRLTLIAELMGRNANLILCEESGKVIDAVRRTDAADTTRILMPGVGYTPPPAQTGWDFCTGDPRVLTALLRQEDDRPLWQALLAQVPGISPLVCRELAFAAGGVDLPCRALTGKAEDAFLRRLWELREDLQRPDPRFAVILDENGKPRDFTFFVPRQYGADAPVQVFADGSEMLDAFYAKREQKARMHAKAQSLHKFLNTAIARLTRTVNVRQAEREAAANCEELRKFGELLKANCGRIPPGAEACRVPDYYDPECKEVTIPLQPALTPQQNAQRYFKEYRKKCTAAGLLDGLIQKGETELAYLDSVREALERAETESDLNAIRQELEETGWLKVRTNKKGKLKPAPAGEPMKFRSDDGFLIRVGRNNRQNDQLTLKQSDGRDLWFHVKTIPGSHVVIRTEGQPVPDTTMTQAAILAATYSKGADSTGVAVDYCPVKRVKKAPGSPPGMVIYENYNTAYVNPDPGLAEKLKI